MAAINREVRLTNVRGTFVHLCKPHGGKDLKGQEIEPRYSLQVLINPETEEGKEQYKTVMRAAKEVFDEANGIADLQAEAAAGNADAQARLERAIKVWKKMKLESNFFMSQIDNPDYPDTDGMWKLNPKTPVDRPPALYVYDPKNPTRYKQVMNESKEAQDAFYSGAYYAVRFQIFWSANFKKIGTSLLQVYFWGHGERMGVAMPTDVIFEPPKDLPRGLGDTPFDDDDDDIPPTKSKKPVDDDDDDDIPPTKSKKPVDNDDDDF